MIFRTGQARRILSEVGDDTRHTHRVGAISFVKLFGQSKGENWVSSVIRIKIPCLAALYDVIKIKLKAISTEAM